MLFRTITTLVALAVLAGATTACLVLHTPFFLYALSTIVLLLSFLEAVRLIQGMHYAKVTLLCACVSSALAVTLFDVPPSVVTVEHFVSLPIAALLAFCAGMTLLFLSVAMTWRKTSFPSAAMTAGWFFVIFIYFGIAAPATLRILIWPQYVIPDLDRPLGASANLANAGVYFFVVAVLTAKAADIAALLGGRLFGKIWFKGKPLSPRISPKKTVAGFVIGVGASSVLGFLALWYNPFGEVNEMIAVAFGLLVALASVGGDLFESVAKRSFSLKDSGRALPGIGGWFDLTDSLFWSGPVAYALLLLNFYIVGSR
ncbi:MAG: phosphatidate cytidylyltransferase [Candidatus Brocadiia bacterium]